MRSVSTRRPTFVTTQKGLRSVHIIPGIRLWWVILYHLSSATSTNEAGWVPSSTSDYCWHVWSRCSIWSQQTSFSSCKAPTLNMTRDAIISLSHSHTHTYVAPSSWCGTNSCSSCCCSRSISYDVTAEARCLGWRFRWWLYNILNYKYNRFCAIVTIKAAH